MKKLLYVFLLSSFLFRSVCYSQSVNLTSLSTQSLCAGTTSFSVSYSTAGTFSNNQINVELSDKNGSFTNYQVIGSGTASPINVNIPSNLPSGVSYKVRLASVSPVIRSNESAVITFSKVSFLNIYNTQNDNITYNELNIMCTGRMLTITTALTDTTGMTFQWRKDGVNITPSGNYSKYKLSSQGRYSVSMQQGSCPTINSPQGPYVYYYNSINWTTSVGVSGSTTQCNGGSVGLFAAAYTDSVSYQWYRDNQIIPGATSRNYTATQSGVYQYIGLDGGCNYNGTTSRLSIINTPLSISVSDSLNRTIASICNGASIKLIATPSGGDAPNFSFAWQKNNVTISGATSATYTTTQPGIYKSVITQLNCGNATSNNYTLNTTNLLQVGVTSADSIKCLGQFISLSSNYSTPTASYQWKKNNQNIIGANAQNYTASSSGAYSLTISDYSCSGTSNIKNLKIGGVQQSTKTSSWTDVSTWLCGTVPVSTDEVIINAGHTVTIPNNYSSILKKLTLNGSLLYGMNSKLDF